jgi:hypothetical protein
MIASTTLFQKNVCVHAKKFSTVQCYTTSIKSSLGHLVRDLLPSVRSSEVKLLTQFFSQHSSNMSDNGKIDNIDDDVTPSFGEQNQDKS